MVIEKWYTCSSLTAQLTFTPSSSKFKCGPFKLAVLLLIFFVVFLGIVYQDRVKYDGLFFVLVV